MKVALIEAGHWHVPLYVDGLSGPDVDVVAVSDTSGGAGRAIADRFEANLYSNLDELLACEAIDFAFVFGRHCDMAGLGQKLVAARIPFTLEKPCGVSVAQVESLRDAAGAAELFVAVPFVYRLDGGLRDALAALEGGLPSDFTHLSFRFIGGPPGRYIDAGCAWMLDPAQAGGGVTINLACHFIDLVRQLTGSEVVSVSATMSGVTHDAGIEDFSVMTLRLASDAVAVIETGYTFPSRPDAPKDFSFTMRSGRHYVRSVADGIEVLDAQDASVPARVVPVELGHDHCYAQFARETLRAVAAGHRPACGLSEAAAVMRVIEGAYRNTRADGQSSSRS